MKGKLRISVPSLCSSCFQKYTVTWIQNGKCSICMILQDISPNHSFLILILCIKWGRDIPVIIKIEENTIASNPINHASFSFHRLYIFIYLDKKRLELISNYIIAKIIHDFFTHIFLFFFFILFFSNSSNFQIIWF